MGNGKKVVTLGEEAPGATMDDYSIPTPFGMVTISRGGRRVTYDLHPGIKQSRHNVALYGYIERLLKDGVTRLNTSHIRVRGRDKTLSLTRGKAKLDLVYYRQGRVYECELKTSREIGLDVTAVQLTELCRHVDELTLLVPRGRLEEAHTIVQLINLKHQITIVPYDGTDADEDEG